MNEVSIIINGIKYDAVDESAFCVECDLIDMCKAHCNFKLCEQLGINFGYIFKESIKSFEK